MSSESDSKRNNFNNKKPWNNNNNRKRFRGICLTIYSFQKIKMETIGTILIRIMSGNQEITLKGETSKDKTTMTTIPVGTSQVMIQGTRNGTTDKTTGIKTKMALMDGIVTITILVNQTVKMTLGASLNQRKHGETTHLPNHKIKSGVVLMLGDQLRRRITHLKRSQTKMNLMKQPGTSQAAQADGELKAQQTPGEKAAHHPLGIKRNLLEKGRQLRDLNEKLIFSFYLILICISSISYIIYLQLK